MSKDPTAEQRKKDHIQLAFESIVENRDKRFYYEPILKGFPKDLDLSTEICGQKMHYPIWISSMTGGTEHAASINTRLAKACGKFRLGMGLGSCRQLLDSSDRLSDFAVRKWMPDSPLVANLGIAQVQELEDQNKLDKIGELLKRLEADGLFIHINPLQEWTQPEGDRYFRPPLQTIENCLEKFNFPILVKEVGQGMGPQSLEALLKLPLEAIELGAHGGTNFAKLELLRGSKERKQSLAPVVHLGHSAEEMVSMINSIIYDNRSSIQTQTIIASGGVRTFLDGYYLTESLRMPAIYAQASEMLRRATVSEEAVEEYISIQIEGLEMSHSFLSIKEKV